MMSLRKFINNNRCFYILRRKQTAFSCSCQALTLLEEIKESLFGLLLPQHTKVKHQISEVLDSDLIKQQVENGTLDFRVSLLLRKKRRNNRTFGFFQHYAQYVISVMLKLCAPVRDENIKALSNITDVVETFKSIFEV